MNLEFIKKLVPDRFLPRWAILFMDITIVAVSFLFAYLIAYQFDRAAEIMASFRNAVITGVFLSVSMFLVLKPYRNVLRFSSFQDILKIFVTLLFAYAANFLIDHFVFAHMDVRIPPMSVVTLAYLIAFLVMSISRIMVKMIWERFSFDQQKSKMTFVYGAKVMGCSIAKMLRSDPMSKYEVVGFIADEPDLAGKTIVGLPVYKNDDKLVDIIYKKNIEAVIISPAKHEDVQNTDFLNKMLAIGIKIMTVSTIKEWDERSLDHTKVREYSIEDLLQRPPIQIDMRRVASHIEGKRVLVTGAAGSIGSEIMRQVLLFNPQQLILLDQAETPLHDVRLEISDTWRDINAVTIVADVSNKARLESIFNKYRPQYVFHAAAYKHVPMMEDDVYESVHNNIVGTRVLADLAVRFGVEKFVMVSTDKAVNPTNVMGCSKRICEIYVQSLARKIAKEGNSKTQFITTRFGNVLGSNGSVIPRFRAQIERGGPVTVTHPEIIRYFMTIPEACRLVLEAGSMGNGGEIYIFDMGKPVKIADLARTMIRLSGKKDVSIEYTGLRHGEKLYEELLNVKEFTKPTSHEKVMIAEVREYDYDFVRTEIDDLISISKTNDNMKIVAKMKQIVPEFLSQNSEYEVLDK
jgi:FlaA1/EpsC-like NDP-sugar epimerase